MQQKNKNKLALGLALLSGAALAGGNDGSRQEGMLDVNGAQIHYVSQGFWQLNLSGAGVAQQAA